MAWLCPEFLGRCIGARTAPSEILSPTRGGTNFHSDDQTREEHESSQEKQVAPRDADNSEHRVLVASCGFSISADGDLVAVAANYGVGALRVSTATETRRT